MPNTSKQKAWFGWCMYDWANSSFATAIMAAVFPVYFASLVPKEGVRFSLFGLIHMVPAAAVWGYVISFSMLLVAVSAPYLGALADQRGLHRRFLMLFCLTGAFATSLLGLAGPGRYLFAGALFVVANFSFATGNVFYNAFLPVLANPREIDRLSARGFAYGYVGGGLELLLVFLIIQGYTFLGLPDRGSAIRLGFLITGLWWAGFALPTFFLVRQSPIMRRLSPLTASLRGYLKTFAEVRRYRDLLLFLVAFLFYNDGIQTIIVVSAIFGREELGLSQGTILGCFLMIQFVAMPGALVFGRFADRWGPKRSVLGSLALFTMVTMYAYFMEHGWEFWILAFIIALILGGSQAVSRSLFASLIPSGKNAEFFGFYAISAKFASIFGPFIFALIAHLTGSLRLSILALVGFFAIGIILLALVDVKRGKFAAQGVD